MIVRHARRFARADALRDHVSTMLKPSMRRRPQSLPSPEPASTPPPRGLTTRARCADAGGLRGVMGRMDASLSSVQQARGLTRAAGAATGPRPLLAATR